MRKLLRGQVIRRETGSGKRFLEQCSILNAQVSIKNRKLNIEYSAEWRALLVVMPDIQSLDHENGIFRDVCCVVSDPFQIPGDQQQIQRLLN